jgi:putative sterol carrier protein
VEIKTPKEFFESVLPAKFDGSKAAGFDAVIQMNITGPNGGDWIVTIKDQKVDVKQGVHPSPSISIRMTDTDYVDMINGRLSGERAFMTGKLKFKGSMAIGMKLRDIGFI